MTEQNKRYYPAVESLEQRDLLNASGPTVMLLPPGAGPNSVRVASIDSTPQVVGASPGLLVKTTSEIAGLPILPSPHFHGRQLTPAEWGKIDNFLGREFAGRFITIEESDQLQTFVSEDFGYVVILPQIAWVGPGGIGLGAGPFGSFVEETRLNVAPPSTPKTMSWLKLHQIEKSALEIARLQVGLDVWPMTTQNHGNQEVTLSPPVDALDEILKGNLNY